MIAYGLAIRKGRLPSHRATIASWLAATHQNSRIWVPDNDLASSKYSARQSVDRHQPVPARSQLCKKRHIP
jgi:hypothetical protein